MNAPLDLAEAQARLLALVEPLPIEQVAVAGALGRYLAAPRVAGRTQPACDLSAMDGYAVAATDLAGPWQLVGESAAGHPFDGAISPGTAVRISTGALLPAGAGAVIVQEDIARAGDRIALSGSGPAAPGAHIRKLGSDFAEGAELLPTGTAITPAVLALALASGHAQLPVRRVPRITVIDCGDELAVDPGACALHQIPASNGAMLAAMLAGLPCIVTRIGPVPDQAAALRAALDQSATADLIVTSGGASVGDHDIVRPVLADWGAALEFWRVAIKPGKPLLIARRGAQMILGLPGNPVSSHVTAFLFLLPLVRALLGAAAPLPRPLRAVLALPLTAGGGRHEFLRAHWDGESVTPATVQDSGGLAALARANALIDRAAGAIATPANGAVSIYLLQNGGIA